MFKKIKTKKAVITPEFIIGVVLILLTIVIAFFFWGRMGFKGLVDNQACHESILLRDTFNLGTAVEVGRSVLPLQCQTQKICINSGGLIASIKGDTKCPEFRDSTSGVASMSLKSSDPQKAEDEIVEIIADEMANCWKTVGEGYLDFSPRSKSATKTSYCSLCTRIAFNEKLKQTLSPIKYEKLYKYMETTQMPSASSKKVTYLKFLYNRATMDDIRAEIQQKIKDKQFSSNPLGEKILTEQKASDMYEMTIDPKKEYVIITTFNKTGWGGYLNAALLGSGAGIATIIGFAALTGITGGLGAIVLFAGAGAAGGTYIFSQNYDDVQTTSPALVEFNQNTLQAFNCGTFEWIP